MSTEKQLAKIMLDESCYLEMLANKLIANVRPGHVEYVSKSDEYVSKSDAAVALLRVVKSLRESATGILAEGKTMNETATATWYCPDCDNELNVSQVWLYDHGFPVCPDCDIDMEIEQ